MQTGLIQFIPSSNGPEVGTDSFSHFHNRSMTGLTTQWCFSDVQISRVTCFCLKRDLTSDISFARCFHCNQAFIPPPWLARGQAAGRRLCALSYPLSVVSNIPAEIEVVFLCFTSPLLFSAIRLFLEGKQRALWDWYDLVGLGRSKQAAKSGTESNWT